MNTTILRETRKITIDNINNDYISKAEVDKYIKAINQPNLNSLPNKRKSAENINRSRMKKNRCQTFNTSEIEFNTWYKENKHEIDLVFGTILGIYTSKKVVFNYNRNELYTLFVKKYYRKVETNVL